MLSATTTQQQYFNTCVQAHALKHHVIMSSLPTNTALITSTRDTARPPAQPPARIRDNNQTLHFSHVRTHTRTRVPTPKFWWHYTALWLFIRGRALACRTTHTSAHVEGGAWGGRHPSWTCDSNSLGRDEGVGYEPPVLSMLDGGGGCLERSP